MGMRTWSSTTYREHQQQIHVDAKAGLDLGCRSLSPAQIKRQYTRTKVAGLLATVNHQHYLDRHGI